MYNCMCVCERLCVCVCVQQTSISSAINDSSDLTDPLGTRMAEFPLNPMFARMLLKSGWLVCVCMRVCVCDWCVCACVCVCDWCVCACVCVSDWCAPHRCVWLF